MRAAPSQRDLGFAKVIHIIGINLAEFLVYVIGSCSIGRRSKLRLGD
jgi:hypothetical protein